MYLVQVGQNTLFLFTQLSHIFFDSILCF